MVDLNVSDTNDWNFYMANEIFDKDLVRAIFSIKGPSLPTEDRLLWRENNSGMLTVSNSYLMYFPDFAASNQDIIWSMLWKLKIHEFLKVFLWRLLDEVIPYWKVIGRIISGGENYCGICGEEGSFIYF